MRIETCFKDGAFVAMCGRKWDIGHSRAEAIGQLIMSYPETFGIELSFCEPDEVPYDAHNAPDPEKVNRK